MTVRAYTVGNPEVYENELNKAMLLNASGLPQDPVMKQPGGIVFARLYQAQACLNRHGGRLPAHWVEGRNVPGAIYGLDLPGPMYEVTKASGDFGWERVLKVEARMVRIA